MARSPTFLVLGENAFGSKVEAAIDLGRTMFPIVFAAIYGCSIKMTARHLAEKGAKLNVGLRH